MAKWWDALRDGYETGRVQYGGQPPRRRQPEGQPDAPPHDPNGWDLPPMEEPVADQTSEIEALQATIAGLQGEVTALKAQLTEDAQRIGTLTEAAAVLRGHLVTAHTAYEPLIEVLKLPGVRKWLLEKFHPDRYPDANPVQRDALERAAGVINAAYDIVKEPPAPSGE